MLSPLVYKGRAKNMVKKNLEKGRFFAGFVYRAGRAANPLTNCVRSFMPESVKEGDRAYWLDRNGVEAKTRRRLLPFQIRHRHGAIPRNR